MICSSFAFDCPADLLGIVCRAFWTPCRPNPSLKQRRWCQSSATLDNLG